MMPYFKVDDQLHSHPKARRAGLAAMGLWTVAGSHCMPYKSDGFVPDWFVTSWPQGRKLAGQLVDAGLWSPAERDGEQGWQFHDWDDIQLTAEEIEADREYARARQRRHRAKLRAGRDMSETP